MSHYRVFRRGLTVRFVGRRDGSFLVSRFRLRLRAAAVDVLAATAE